ncbi:MAG: hypothetical protein U0324_13455 [Polyangiales bacterium]
MTPDALPALPPIVAARALLDDALVASRRIAAEATPREEVVDGLAEALRCVYLALSSLGDAHGFAAARAQAVGVLGGVLATLQHPAVDDPAVGDVVQVAARALRLLVGAPIPVLDPGPDLPRAHERRPAARATLGLPALLDLQRAVLRPSVPLPEMPPPEEAERETDVPPPPETDLELLRAEGRAALDALDALDAPGAADDGEGDEDDEPPAPWDPARAERAAFGERLTAMDVLFERARGCLEDLGAFGRQRRPMDDEGWWAPRTEARLLARVDALAACGDAVLPWLVRLLEERPVPDAEYTWATVLLFGSIAGDDAADQAMRVARLTPVDEPELRDALADAFTHAPHPGFAALLEPWLDDGSAGRRVVALTALSRRGALPLARVEPHLQDGDPEVVRAAVEALAHVPEEVPRALLLGVLHHPDDAVLAAALDLAARRGSALALDRAKELLAEGTPGRGDAAMHVAIASTVEALALLHGDVALTEAGCEALGWFGHAASVRALLHALEAGAEPVAARAAEALWRITGAPLTDDDPDPELDEAPFGEAAWADDELPECPESLSVDRAVWGAWWEKREAGVDRAARWRFGRRWRVCDLVRGLASRNARPRERRWSALELVARTGATLPFDAWRFLPEQLAQIEAWRARARGAGDGWAARGGWR